MRLIELFVRRHVLAFVLSAVVVLFGVVAYQRIGVDRYPAIEQPVLTVSTRLPGASPEVIDQSVTQVIEAAVNGIPGVDILDSTSYTGRSSVTILFDLDKDINVAFAEVQSKIEQVRRSLPEQAESPVISKTDDNASPILFLALTGNRTERELYLFANNVLKKQLETIDGVGEVGIRGRGERVIRVELDPVQLAAYKLTAKEVQTAFAREHRQEAGGYLTDGPREYLVDLDQEFHSVSALKGLVIGWYGQAPVKLGEVARVIDGEADVRALSRFKGQPCVTIGIVRIPNTNTVAIVDAVLKRLDTQIRPTLPPGLRLDIAGNSADFIREMVRALQEHLLEGTLLAALVVWMFLRNWRATLIVALAIPVSLLGAAAVMYFLGYTFNAISLLALLLLIGVVVDDAIVVLEAIHRREENGEDPVPAAIHGAREVVFAVVAATLALVAIFLPVVFLSSTVGRLFNTFAVVVSCGVLVSLLVAVTLTPMLCSRFLKAQPRHGRVFRGFEQVFESLERVYKVMLSWTLHHPWSVLVAAMLLVVAGLTSLSQLKVEFYPKEDEGRFQMSVKVPVGASLAYNDDRTRLIEKKLAQIPEVDAVLAVVGGFSGRNAYDTRMVVRLKPRAERRRSQDAVMKAARKTARSVPGVKVTAYPYPRAGESSGGQFKFNVVGPNLDQVGRLADDFANHLARYPALGSFDRRAENRLPKLTLAVRREAAARAGLSTADLLDALNLLTSSAKIGNFSDGDGERYEVRLQAADYALSRPQDLEAVYLRNASGTLVPLSSVAQVQHRLGPTQISRMGQMYSVGLTSSPDLPLADAMQVVRREAARFLPPGYRIEFLDEARELDRTGGELVAVFVLASLMLYLVLAAQFNSFRQPALIMLAEPLALVGGLLALWLTGQTLNVYSVIGLVLLIGLVAKNGILLVDITNQYHVQGLTVDEALRVSCPIRLRPVLMTTLTVILAMLPAAFGLSAGAETNGPLAVAVIGGLIFSTVLTLLIIPCGYLLLERHGLRH
ncbi:efflux RND transporter permease subunit [Pseudogulbenkiania subflava]|uniref:Hydrophobic/amphiphilic exporter-1, HAE1 family n=1 Tax=Pseudogulbenkiania subflava DSM 22618 TaxID=1123014 RepID=A0A1Y6B9P6_9NEIS|nr:efflux RND transporter permease subunit [Pseudogulbenkiania subflava]SME93116.1 hydrophobic/amphiphilic exporter-1, HAE1 family [Pseudogulbenkiania subflava DSM 22618]